MKRILKTTFLIGVLSFALTPVSFAQDIDANRMNRDIRIMENILGELFKMQNSLPGNARMGNFVLESNFPGAKQVRGTYLPDFGVIFNIQNRNNVFFYESQNGNSYQSSFYYSSESSDSEEAEEVTEESVVSRISEFLKDYGSTIGQLDGNDKILVIYGSKSRNSVVFKINSDDTNQEEAAESLPVISVSVPVKDLADYRRGRLNDSQLEERLEVATSEEKDYLDLKVLSNIIETALREQEPPSFRAIGGVDYLMLDNFGALYSFDVRLNSRRGGNAYVLELARRMSNRTVSVNQNSDSETDEEYQQMLSEAYESLISNTKEYIIDYGRTLSSVNSDQYLLVSITVHGRHQDIPDRIEIQVKKSVLDQFDRGRVSREQALEQVVVTEY